MFRDKLRQCADNLLQAGFDKVNQSRPWYDLPPWIGVINLFAFREELRQKNLHDMAEYVDDYEAPEWDADMLYGRSADGTFNDLEDLGMGRAGAPFGRNVPIEFISPEKPPKLYQPNPLDISQKLLARDKFTPATSLNLLAAAWIQFQVHGWVNHLTMKGAEEEFWNVPRAGDWSEDEMSVRRSLPVPHSRDDRPPAYINTETHWWDGSQIYGSSAERQAQLRSGDQGKLRVGADGLLLVDTKKKVKPDLTGFNDNYWVGLSLMHTLFTLEHNAICDRLLEEYPRWDDERLFRTARLVNCALIAKIHTVEWTTGVLLHPALQLAMNGNWYGLLSQQVQENFGRVSSSEELSGIPGSKKDHHRVPYSLTEEFVTVYRMHPLIPDLYDFYGLCDGEQIGQQLDFEHVQGKYTREVVKEIGIPDLFYSFGIAHPGAIRLHNYPNGLRSFKKENEPLMDVAAVDILRDRERGVPRYNDFRRLLHLKPAGSFAELTDNPQWAQELEEVYSHPDNVDAMVGMFAEPLPPGFAFSDTAFRVFILMASRRLKSDRFFTTDYTPQVYTPAGMQWIDDNTMGSVLLRHYPDLAPFVNDDNAFFPWKKV